ncbi:MAG: hemerythrin domain-containing protein [Proteobacteria bacterium]|nr:hemerythrin domain-containing protein [Pseudomonadota bacterium]
MSDTVLKIKYECLHPSCAVFCRKGKLYLDGALFSELSAANDAEDTFKSPSGVCRLGFSQPFKALSVVEEAIDAAAEGESQEVHSDSDPFVLLEAEHKEVLKKLDLIERQVRKRDVDGLWVTTAMVQNDIILHSIKEEEQLLFPLVLEKEVPMGDSFIAIMKEDHREFISLLHAFRCGLQDGEILDGLVGSLIINLRNHIIKEDEAFFPITNENLEEEDKVKLFDGMIAIKKDHVPIEAGIRSEKPLSPLSEDRDKIDAELVGIREGSSKGGGSDAGCCAG